MNSSSKEVKVHRGVHVESQCEQGTLNDIYFHHNTFSERVINNRSTNQYLSDIDILGETSKCV